MVLNSPCGDLDHSRAGQAALLDCKVCAALQMAFVTHPLSSMLALLPTSRAGGHNYRTLPKHSVSAQHHSLSKQLKSRLAQPQHVWHREKASRELQRLRQKSSNRRHGSSL